MPKNKKKTTDQLISELASAVNRGFDSLEKKVDDHFKLSVDEFDRIRSDIRDIKSDLGPLGRVVAMQEQEALDLRMRVARLERKAGVADNLT